jgi:hypothetical protein
MEFLILFYLVINVFCTIVLLSYFSKKEKLFDFTKNSEVGDDGQLNDQDIEVYKKSTRSGIANLLLGFFLSLFGFFGFGSIGRNIISFGDSIFYNLGMMSLFFLCMILGGRLIIRGRQQTEPSAELIIKYSILPPILYLRKFADDENISYSVDSVYYQGLKFHETIETQFTKALKKIGPLIAVGRPEEKLPIPGASRSYFTDEEWFIKIREYMSKASLIIVSVDFTDGIAKEISEILQTNNLKKTIFYLPIKKVTGNKLKKHNRVTNNDLFLGQLIWCKFFSEFNIQKNETIELQLREKKICQFLYFDKYSTPTFYKPKYANSDHLKLNQLENLTKDFCILIDLLEKNQ